MQLHEVPEQVDEAHFDTNLDAQHQSTISEFAEAVSLLIYTRAVQMFKMIPSMKRKTTID